MLYKHVPSLKCDSGIKPFPCVDCNWNPVRKVADEHSDKEKTGEEVPISFSSCEEFFIHLEKFVVHVCDRIVILTLFVMLFAICRILILRFFVGLFAE